MTINGMARRGLLVTILGCALVVGGFTSVATAGAPEAGKSKTTTFIGEVPGTEAFIGIVVGKTSARAYLCDSKELGEWLEGAVAGGTIALESEGGATLVAEVKGKSLRGTLVLGDNRVIAVDAKKAKGKAGLFRKEVTIDGQEVLAGWVRTPDGSVRGGLRNVLEQLFTPDVTVAAPIGPGVGSTNGVVVIPAPPPPPPPAVAAQVPEAPPANAVVKEAPPLEETVAATAAPLPLISPPTGFDADACSRINRALAALADELDALDALDSDDLRAVVFQGTFKRLHDRAIFGGCQGVLEL